MPSSRGPAVCWLTAPWAAAVLSTVPFSAALAAGGCFRHRNLDCENDSQCLATEVCSDGTCVRENETSENNSPADNGNASTGDDDAVSDGGKAPGADADIAGGDDTTGSNGDATSGASDTSNIVDATHDGAATDAARDATETSGDGDVTEEDGGLNCESDIAGECCFYNGTEKGVCRRGTTDPETGTCEAPAAYEDEETICDQLDNDCDGSADEDCSVNLSFESVYDDSACARPEHWEFADKSTGYTSQGNICSSTNSTDGDRAVKISWTGNSNGNKADIWQRFDLDGISTVELDIFDPGGGSPERSKHLILIDGTQVKDCGHVGDGEQTTCTVDVSDLDGVHEFRHRWKQRTGDNLGNSAIDDVRLLQ